MDPWTLNMKLLYDTQFIFGSLMFTDEEDGNLELLTRGPAPRHLAPVYRESLYYPTDLSTSSTSSSSYSGLNPHAGSYHLFTVTSRGHPIEAPIFQPLVGTSSSVSLGATHDRDFIEDYPKIGGNAYWNPANEAHHISMVGPGKANSQNSSSRNPTIWGSKASDAWTPSNNHPELEPGLQRN
jgi:hypothetical protein